MSGKKAGSASGKDPKEIKKATNFSIDEILWNFICEVINAKRSEKRWSSVSAFIEAFVEKLGEDPIYANSFQQGWQPIIDSDNERGKHFTTLSLSDKSQKTLDKQASQWLRKKGVKSRSYVVERLIEGIQSGNISLDDLSINIQKLPLSSQDDSLELPTEVKFEADTLTSELATLTLNPVSSTTPSSTDSALDSTSNSGEGKFLEKTEFRLSVNRETLILPIESGVFFVAFILSRRIYKTTRCFSASNMQLYWDALLQADEDLAKNYKKCEQSTFFIWRICSSDSLRESLMPELQRDWDQFFQQNRAFLVLRARFCQNWANLKYVLSRLFQTQISNSEPGQKKVSGAKNIEKLTFAMMMLALIALVAFNDLTRLTGWIDSKVMPDANRGLIIQISTVLEYVLSGLLLTYAIVKSLKQRTGSPQQNGTERDEDNKVLPEG